ASRSPDLSRSIRVVTSPAEDTGALLARTRREVCAQSTPPAGRHQALSAISDRVGCQPSWVTGESQPDASALTKTLPPRPPAPDCLGPALGGAGDDVPRKRPPLGTGGTPQ